MTVIDRDLLKWSVYGLLATGPTVFTTILGVCIVDAFVVYEYEVTLNHGQPEDFTFFVVACRGC
jgi:hypothetical protein